MRLSDREYIFKYVTLLYEKNTFRKQYFFRYLLQA